MMNNQFNAANLTAQPHGIQMAQHVAATTPPQQQHQQQQQHSSAAVLNSFYNAQHHHQHNQQQQHPQQHQQLATAMAAANGGLYADPRQLQLPANALDKAYYTTALGTPQRFYTTAGPGAQVGTGNVVAAAHPNTILITNNFTHQQTPQTQSPPDSQRVTTALNHPGNIRIVSTSGTAPNLVNSTGAFQHAQHVFNLGNTKALHQLFPQHLLPQQQQAYHPAPEVIAHQFSAQHFPGTPNTTATATSMQIPQYYVAAPEAPVAQLPSSNTKLLANNVTAPSGNTTTSSPLNVGVVGAGNTSANGSSTVVLDRINICINNLYTDTSSSSASNSLASTPAQQPSPIIPAIQHKAIIDSGPPPILSPAGETYEAGVLVIDEPDSTTTATTPHTPPTTPENTPPSVASNCSNNNNITTTTSSINSPSTSSTTISSMLTQQQDGQITHKITTTKQHFATVAHNIEEAAAVLDSGKFPQSSTSAIKNSNSNTPLTQTSYAALPSNAPLTPPTPPSPEITGKTQPTNIVDLTASPSTPAALPEMAALSSPLPLFDNGEDVFIKRQDGRFYLGTVIDRTTASNQFLIRFDDKTELWCKAEEMRKLGGGSSSSTTSTESKKADTQPMCLACKQQQPESKVEICERCGRGYHRQCTRETSAGSNVWICKRCDKPMKLNVSVKLDLISDDDSDFETVYPRRLPYDLNSLTWDSKHRVNEEQIYCYCAKTGKFDHNMLQCCRCLNWYHTQCTAKCKGDLLRGDSFFIFACSVCNDGEEYIRRLQLNWVDLAHLIIYNLSTLKKHQHHKYHHLLKDIYPFALERRSELPLTQELRFMPENDFLNKIQSTLMETTERFVCGKEIKRDHYFFALRTNGPPVAPKIPLKADDVLTDDFVVNVLKLKLLKGAPENADMRLIKSNKTEDVISTTPTSKPKTSDDSSSHDVYAFDDTSEDEIPIKLILDKVKKKNKLSDDVQEPTTPSNSLPKSILEEMDVEDDNANDLIITTKSEVKEQQMLTTTTTTTTPSKNDKKPSPKKETKALKSSSENTTSTDENVPLVTKTTTSTTAASKHTEKSSRKRKAFNLTKSYDAQRLFDSSSDENSSSSSRGTSLDLIIPPPKNFLGQNNPFRVVTPKKNNDKAAASSSSGGKKSVSFGIFNTSGLNFSSKLAALKSAGLFPKLSTSNLAKAAGQPRTVRTIKRRLSAKDITIGPNQEVRRRRTRRLSANIEVISTTTINPIPTNFFPIHAKDLLAAAAASNTTAASLFTTQTKTTTISSSPTTSSSTCITTIVSNHTTNPLSPKQETATSSVIDAPPIPAAVAAADSKLLVPTHGRRLRQRPPKSSPNTSRRSSVSSNQSSASSTNSATTLQQQQLQLQLQQQQQQTQNAHQSHEDLKQTVNKYFGIVNRIESGEQFSIRAKRQLANGQMQYLIEWGEQPTPPPSLPTVVLMTPQQQFDTSPTKVLVSSSSSSPQHDSLNVNLSCDNNSAVVEQNISNVV